MPIFLAAVFVIWGVAISLFIFRRSIVKLLTKPDNDPKQIASDRALRASELQARYGLSTEYSVIESGFCVQYNTSLIPGKYIDKIMQADACSDYAKDPSEAIINFANKVGLP